MRSPVRWQVCRVGIDTWREDVAYLHRDCPVVRAAGFQALSKVSIAANGVAIVAVLNVVDDPRIVAPCDLGLSLSEETLRRLGVADGVEARIEPTEPPASITALPRMIAGERRSRTDLQEIIRDIAQARYSKIELAAFVVATNPFDLDRDQVLHLTEAMIAAGQRIEWQRKAGGAPVVDTRGIGGIPGNRSSMRVLPIVTAHGMWCPKTSSRAITSRAGTADTMEVLAEVELPLGRLTEIVRATHGCLAWGGTAELSPADDMLISVGRPLAIDSPGQMVASILSKKIAAGSMLVLDRPLGPTAKVRSMPEAQGLKRWFEYVAGRLNLQLDTVITDASQPASQRASRARHRPGAGSARRDAGAGAALRARGAARPAPRGAAPGRPRGRARQAAAGAHRAACRRAAGERRGHRPARTA